MIRALSPLVRGMSMILWFLVYPFCVLLPVFPAMVVFSYYLSSSFQCLYPAHSCCHLFCSVISPSFIGAPSPIIPWHAFVFFHHRPGLFGLHALCIIMPVCNVCWMLNCFELNTRYVVNGLFPSPLFLGKVPGQIRILFRGWAHSYILSSLECVKCWCPLTCRVDSLTPRHRHVCPSSAPFSRLESPEYAWCLLRHLWGYWIKEYYRFGVGNHQIGSTVCLDATYNIVLR